MIDSGLWEGYHESRRCSRDTNPESYITKCTSIRRLAHSTHTADYGWIFWSILSVLNSIETYFRLALGVGTVWF